MAIMEIACAFPEMLEISAIVYHCYVFPATAYIEKRMDLFEPWPSNHSTMTIHNVIHQWKILTRP